MKTSVFAAAVPTQGEIARHVPGAHFQDCYIASGAIAMPPALQIYLDVVSRTPGWVNMLMALRNKVVSLVGLKNLGHLGEVNKSKAVNAYRVGDRVGIFSLLYLTEEEVILGDSDRHLDVRLSVRRVAGKAVAVSTVVHIHNLLGRLYMVFVVPVHKVIVRAMLKRLVSAQHVA